MGAAGGVVSCIDDLLKLYGAVLKACIHQFNNNVSSTPDNPFKHMYEQGMFRSASGAHLL